MAKETLIINKKTAPAPGKTYQPVAVDVSEIECEDQLRDDPTHEAALLYLAKKNVADRRHEKALDYSQRLLDQMPGHKDALKWAASSALALEKTAVAHEMLTRYTTEYPDDPDGFFNLGLLKLHENQTHEATAYFNQAKRLSSDAEFHHIIETVTTDMSQN